jgi:hypothetical protein|tara:strand:- start:172 stop:390 length:219 start_codon:yes stop_codon:yes gene_type:complete
MDSNNIDSIDKKINKVANDNLDSLENILNHLEHMDSDELRSEAKKMIDDCSKNEIKKVLKLLIDIARKSFED